VSLARGGVGRRDIWLTGLLVGLACGKRGVSYSSRNEICEVRSPMVLKLQVPY
jgi:hypothetical protein